MIVHAAFDAVSNQTTRATFVQRTAVQALKLCAGKVPPIREQRWISGDPQDRHLPKSGLVRLPHRTLGRAAAGSRQLPPRVLPSIKQLFPLRSLDRAGLAVIAKTLEKNFALSAAGTLCEKLHAAGTSSGSSPLAILIISPAVRSETCQLGVGESVRPWILRDR